MGKTIEIIGLGAGDLEQLPLGVYRKLTGTKKAIYARTVDHPVIAGLVAEGVAFASFDAVYEKHDDFQTVYESIVATLLEKAQTESLLYVVPGHPMLAEQTVQLLLAQTDVTVEISGGQSYLDDLFTALQIDPIDGFQFLDATSFTREEISYTNHLVFCQVYDQFIASELKLTLLEDLPPDYDITIVEAAGTTGEKIIQIPLAELDRGMEVSNLTSVYVPPAPTEVLQHQFATLRAVIRTLRGPDGCPWDRRQTHNSLRKYALEEVYELLDAIDREDDEGIIEELGDVLLQVMLHSQIGEDDGYFTIDDVIRGITEKMIHRHPHVFDKEAAPKSWEQLKQEERGKATEFLLDAVLMSAPALQVAEQLQKKAARVGFDWDDVRGVWEKLDEEMAEFHEAVAADDQAEMEAEFGDILFVLANLARFYNIAPELALTGANRKFLRRFTEMEKLAREQNRDTAQFTLREWDELWEEVKRKE